jgi:carboxypeptidase D
LTFAYNEGIVKEGTQMSRNLDATQAICLTKIEAAGRKGTLEIDECEAVLQDLLKFTKNSDDKCYNMYDIRLRDEFPACGMNWPPDLASVTPYLRRDDVVRALNINPDKKSGWQECRGAVSGSFTTKNSVASAKLLPGLLESGLPILLYSGDKDLICNHVGTEQLIHNMQWSGGTGFETSPGVWAPRHDWTFEDEATGIYQYARNLTYVLFYNASHMVPYDLPRQSRDMLDRFIKVDIASIGGTPADSRIDGEKLPQTAVGGHPNSTAVEEQQKEEVKETEWKAYAKSGEAVLVIVIIGVCVWGFFIWRSRQRTRGYHGLQHGRAGSALDRFYNKRFGDNDVEAADFDAAEMERLNPPDMEREHYAVGEDSDDEGNRQAPQASGPEDAPTGRA